MKCDPEAAVMGRRSSGQHPADRAFVVSIAMGFTFAAASGVSTACLVDDDNRCGSVYVEAKDGSCTCPEGEVPSDDGCAPCGEHETINAGECVCDTGYQRSAGSCVRAQPGSTAAASDDGCTSTEDCPGGTLCDLFGSKECVAAPEGLGQSCTGEADCADTEARFCDIFASNSCQVDGCKEQDGVCPGDMVCCEYAILSRSLCVTPTALEEDGACPAPGVLIERAGDER